MLRLIDWPACLGEEDVAAMVKDAIYEGYEQKAGRKIGLYRLP